MFIEGTVKNYNPDRGFGFIQIEGSSKDIFFHIRDFPKKHIQPKEGEKLKFYLDHNNGKPRAKNIVRLDMIVQSTSAVYSNPRKISIKQQNAKANFNFIDFIIGGVAIVIFCAIFIPFITKLYNRENLKGQPAKPLVTNPHLENQNPSSRFQCDGRIHCSQMNSYEEAVYFINHCPGTKMDGDRDGEPCEGYF